MSGDLVMAGARPKSPTTARWWCRYVTTPDGIPLQQGEGGYGPNDPSGKGVFIYHEYNYTSFEETTHDASVFAVPSVCQNTKYTCSFP